MRCFFQGFILGLRGVGFQGVTPFQGTRAHLLHAALVDALLADEVHLERPPDGRPRVLHLQQRVVDQVLPTPHLPGRAPMLF